MEMKQCSEGHFYDAERYNSCPYCGKGNDKASTHPRILQGENTVDETEPLTEAGSNAYNGDVTVAMDTLQDIRPVVGWLVCISGPSRGRSYEIHKENNYLGRSPQMDICISEDTTISRDSPMVITYDAYSRSFYCGFMGGRSIVRLNDMPLLATTALKRGDMIELGKTKLMFVPFSDETFDWDWSEE